MHIFTNISNRYRDLLSREEESIVKTRIKILLVCLLTFTGLFTALTILYIFQEHNFILVRAAINLVLFIIGLALLLFKSPWKIAGHFFIICVTLLIWSNVLLFLSGVNIVTVQLILVVLACGYYLLGVRWGIIYSLINILPVVSNIIIDNYINYRIPFQHLNINSHAYTITTCFNFTLLLYIHYSFFKALNKSNEKEKQMRTDLQKALVEAQELAIAKTNFLITMSHELRTPLNAIVGMANILLMEDPRPQQNEHLNILRFSAENLMATVNDILDFNKINNEEITLEQQEFQPAILIANIAGSFQPMAQGKQLQFECLTDSGLTGLRVLGDQLRLTQILFQLIGNAIKFTAHGFVHLKVEIKHHSTDTVDLLFSIADSGIGIPEELKAKIFEPFVTSPLRTSRQFHGTLGLTIAFHLVRLHHSELQFHSEEGKGTTFSFELNYPVATGAVQPITDKPPVTAAISALRILVVEDEKLNVLVIKKILNKWGITPDVAEDGQQAVDTVINKDYDLILMDINMPVMDGFEASKRIRQLKAGIPIIAVTASIGAAIERVTNYPFIDDCLLKPFNPEHLKDKLVKIASNSY